MYTHVEAVGINKTNEVEKVKVPTSSNFGKIVLTHYIVMLFLESLLSSHQYHPELYHPGAVPYCLSQTLQQNRSHHLEAAQLNRKIKFQENQQHCRWWI